MGWQIGLQNLNGQSLKGNTAGEKLTVFHFSSVSGCSTGWPHFGICPGAVPEL